MSNEFYYRIKLFDQAGRRKGKKRNIACFIIKFYILNKQRCLPGNMQDIKFSFPRVINYLPGNMQENKFSFPRFINKGTNQVCTHTDNDKCTRHSLFGNMYSAHIRYYSRSTKRVPFMNNKKFHKKSPIYFYSNIYRYNVFKLTITI